jgi:peptidase YpeB-like protein
MTTAASIDLFAKGVPMRARLGVVVLVGALAALTIGALAVSGQQRTLTAADAHRAMRAAENAAGGGAAVRIDRNSKLGAMWEVEVIRPSGRHVDVLLDARFRLIDVGPEREATEPPPPADPFAEPTPRYEPQQATKPQAGAQRPYAPRHPASRYRGDDDHGLSPYDFDRASDVALEAAGGGTVLDVDQDFEAGATWEVEIRMPDGRRVDVLLDASFQVLDVSGEQDGRGHSDDD